MWRSGALPCEFPNVLPSTGRNPLSVFNHQLHIAKAPQPFPNWTRIPEVLREKGSANRWYFQVMVPSAVTSLQDADPGTHYVNQAGFERPSAGSKRVPPLSSGRVFQRCFNRRAGRSEKDGRTDSLGDSSEEATGPSSLLPQGSKKADPGGRPNIECTMHGRKHVLYAREQPWKIQDKQERLSPSVLREKN